MDPWAPLETEDPEIYRVVRDEEARSRSHLELIASESYPSLAVLQATGSVLTAKYAEGYPGRRYYGGCDVVDVGESLARDRARELFGAEHVKFSRTEADRIGQFRNDCHLTVLHARRDLGHDHIAFFEVAIALAPHVSGRLGRSCVHSATTFAN